MAIEKVVIGENEKKNEFIISDEEQLRIIQQTGIMHARPSTLDKRKTTGKDKDKKPLVDIGDVDKSVIGKIEGDEKEDDEGNAEEPLEEQLFTTFLWLIIFSSLFIGLTIAVHAQYGQDYTVKDISKRLRTIVPGLALIIFFSQKYVENLLTKICLFVYSLVGGSMMIYVVNKEGYLVVMQRAPALGTLWIWCIVQLELIPALISLIGVGIYVKYAGHAIFR